MPRLTAFATCSEVLHDQDQHPSLIHVFTSVQVSYAEQEPIPKEAAVPREWRIFTMWQADDADHNQTFDQMCFVTAPNGKEVGNSKLSFTVLKDSHNLIVRIPILPIGVIGRIGIKVWLEKDGMKVTDEFTSSIRVAHVKKEKEAQTTEGHLAGR